MGLGVIVSGLKINDNVQETLNLQEAVCVRSVLKMMTKRQ